MSPTKAATKNRFTIDDFEIVEEISKGAFGVIKLVKRVSTEKPYVLKVVSKSYDKNKYVKRELDNLSLCTNCPFIVTVYDLFDDEKNFYLLQEYVPGGELAAVFSKHRIQMQQDGMLIHHISKCKILDILIRSSKLLSRSASCSRVPPRFKYRLSRSEIREHCCN